MYPPLAPSGPPSAHRRADESMASVHAGWLGFHSNLFAPPFHGSPPISSESSCSHLVAAPFLLTVNLWLIVTKVHLGFSVTSTSIRRKSLTVATEWSFMGSVASERAVNDHLTLQKSGDMVRLRPNLVLTGLDCSTAQAFEGNTSRSPTALGRLSSAPGLPPAPVGTLSCGWTRPSAPCRHPEAATARTAAPKAPPC